MGSEGHYSGLRGEEKLRFVIALDMKLQPLEALVV